MPNYGYGEELESTEEEGSANLSRHHCEIFKTQEKFFYHLDPNEKEKRNNKKSRNYITYD